MKQILDLNGNEIRVGAAAYYSDGFTLVKGFVREIYIGIGSVEVWLTPTMEDSTEIIVGGLINPKMTGVRLSKGQNIVLI